MSQNDPSREGNVPVGEDGFPPGVEIRVHGIGDHVALSALGTAPKEESGSNTEPDVNLPPILPNHRLRLINWSRTSRGFAGPLWYAALPFTLVNVAGYMVRPVAAEAESTSDGEASQRSYWLEAWVMMVGLVLTGLTYTWGTAIAETVVRRVWIGSGEHDATGPVIAWTVGAALILGMYLRRNMRPLWVSRTVLWLHIAVTGVLTGFAIHRPAHWGWPGWSHGDLFTTWGPASRSGEDALFSRHVECNDLKSTGDIVQLVDPLAAVSVIAIVVTGALCLVLTVRGMIVRSTALLGSALAMFSSVLIFISIASALRLALDQALAYTSRHELLIWQDDRSASFFGRGLMAAQFNHCRERDDSIIDVLPLVGVAGASSFAIAFIVANAIRRRRSQSSPGSPLCGRRCRSLWIHDLVENLPKTLPWAMGIATLAFAWCVYLMIDVLADASNEVIWKFAVALIQVLAAVIGVCVLAAGSMTKIRVTFGLVADVVGFWPVAWHPLAGASYREPVVDKIRSRIATKEPVALVGHSQGSVLAAWAVGNGPDMDRSPQLLLVTCGSPIASLYAEFFPAYFDGAFFSRLRSRLGDGHSGPVVEGHLINQTRWVNYWRDTDPISTKMPTGSGAEDVPIPDETDDALVHAHGDYWIEQVQRDRIAAHLSR